MKQFFAITFLIAAVVLLVLVSAHRVARYRPVGQVTPATCCQPVPVSLP